MNSPSVYATPSVISSVSAILISACVIFLYTGVSQNTIQLVLLGEKVTNLEDAIKGKFDMIKVKRGVNFKDCSPEIMWAVIQVDPLFRAKGVDTVVTSGCEPYKHSVPRSRHYSKDAVDLRSRDLKTIQAKRDMRRSLQRKLGVHYVVILERTHFHVHWAPILELETKKKVI